MVLYHGSSIPDIKVLDPLMANNEKKCVYLTHSKVLATIYSHNPLTRPNGFFSYWWSKDGKLYYDEYFENQLEVIYSGQKGYVYECEGEYPQMERMPWVYLAEGKVDVVTCIEIPDICEQLLRYEREGLLTIQHWSKASPRQREVWENVVKRSLTGIDLSTPLGMEYYEYARVHFKSIN